MKKILLSATFFTFLIINTNAQLPFLVELKADNYTTGSWSNTGTLGGVFEITNSSVTKEIINDGDESLPAVTVNSGYLISDFTTAGTSFDSAVVSGSPWTIYIMVYDDARDNINTLFAWGIRSPNSQVTPSFGVTTQGQSAFNGFSNDKNWEDPKIVDGEWLHLSWVFDGDRELKLYIDGILAQTETINTPITPISNMLIAAQSNNNGTINLGANENGTPSIHSIKVSDVAASEFVVLAEYNALITDANSNEISSSIDIYPNPSKDKFYISHRLSSEDITFSLINTQGILIDDIQFTQLSSTNYSIDITPLEKGVYFLKTTTNGSFGIKTIIKE